MPAQKPTNGVASTQSTATSKPFELPALDLTFGSLTDGTNIPPPLPSPKEEQSPPQPRAATKKEDKVEGQQLKAEANGATNGTFPRKPDIAITTNVGLKRTADEVPISPALSSRGSIRRLISKTFLNHAYDEQGSTTGHDVSRPPSRTASVLAEEKKAKRTSSWFRRLRSHDHASDDKPATLQFENVTKKPIGPPPPMIPELSALETKIDTHLGDDLFKGIGRDQ
ncbi:hypothetical protein E0Z10_g886 [Xylaria hypoxylon]|uniref:Uncharacterized protein n=1 Tax=Xylaria hypoxylon TaxID=37992 RepID=A0A4Z0YV14_9PEZI|nr:hypothetical protein E0Z10_g886 [Xylaria hypoxylon]